MIHFAQGGAPAIPPDESKSGGIEKILHRYEAETDPSMMRSILTFVQGVTTLDGLIDIDDIMTVNLSSFKSPSITRGIFYCLQLFCHSCCLQITQAATPESTDPLVTACGAVDNAPSFCTSVDTCCVDAPDFSEVSGFCIITVCGVASSDPHLCISRPTLHGFHPNRKY
uniref:EF-hand domain-containing protein n=1 Tax=Panagrellus redivivus TaxID=6233 RepID=A0A7E4UYH2_PANRE